MERKLVLPALLLCASTSMMPAAESANQTTKSDAQTVKASFYSNKYNGRTTAAKERFSNNALTAAHRQLPFGTKVRLTNPANQRSVVVRVNDRGPNIAGREISVTRRAARELGFTRSGVAPVTMAVLKPGEN